MDRDYDRLYDISSEPNYNKGRDQELEDKLDAVNKMTDQEYLAYKISQQKEYNKAISDSLDEMAADPYYDHYDGPKEANVVYEGKSPNPPNPKQRYGDTKPNLALITPAMEIPLALALMDGAGKYGQYNWRDSKVEILTYIAAAKRHLGHYLEGEDIAIDGVHHLGHVMACCAILLDAFYNGSIIDNRPKPIVGKSMVYTDASYLIQKLNKLREERNKV